MFFKKVNYNIIHDNLNDIWLVADISNKNYKFYYKYKHNPKIIKKRNFLDKYDNIFRIIITSTIVILLFLLLKSNTIDLTNDKIYSEYYTEYPFLTVSRSNSNIDNSLTTFQSNITKNNNDIISHFYNGVILQQEGKHISAIHEYNIVIQNKDNLFVDQAKWYTALCYLKNNDTQKAIEYFNKIEDINYKEKVANILAKIKK